MDKRLQPTVTLAQGAGSKRKLCYCVFTQLDVGIMLDNRPQDHLSGASDRCSCGSFGVNPHWSTLALKAVSLVNVSDKNEQKCCISSGKADATDRPERQMNRNASERVKAENAAHSASISFRCIFKSLCPLFSLLLLLLLLLFGFWVFWFCFWPLSPRRLFQTLHKLTFAFPA